MPFFEKLNRLPRRVIIIRAIAASIVTAVVDFYSGWELSLFVFYAVPIFVVGYRFEQPAALSFAGVNVFLWWFVNRWSHPYQSEVAFAWVTISRGAYMIFVAFGAGVLKKYQESERIRLGIIERETALRADMLTQTEEQQRHFGRELHDGVCQLLSGTALAVESLVQRLAKKAPEESDSAREILGFVRRALTESRDLAHGAFPVQMSGEGLAAALQELVEISARMARGVQITFSQSGSVTVRNPEVAMHLYRIAQEAVGNALKHSNAKNISVTISLKNEDIMLEVRDDGTGLGVIGDEEKGIGLKTMAYRAAQIGARLQIVPGVPKGTRVICLLSSNAYATAFTNQSNS